MLGTLNKRDLAARAITLKAAAQAPPTEDSKLKAVAEGRKFAEERTVGKLNVLEEDRLIEQTSRKLGQALAANCLVLSRLRRWKDAAKEEADKAAELAQRVKDLHSSHHETKVLLIVKSKEALDLFAKNA
ncbi:hypothetical protein VNO80_01518 [Phaseolus coccineus]|uniref:Uncharacterized protein n=1 Tax=Phaseolus coccineus TaxID=3886 RepID=A0AAN9RSX3_PHACN